MSHVLSTGSNTKHTLYFVEAVACDLIKIGITSNLRRRLRVLELQSPVSLVLLLAIPALAIEELAVHAAFHNERHHGEWFAATGRLRSLIYDLSLLDSDAIAMRLDALKWERGKPLPETVA